jgi:hypothetical protein
MTELNTIQLTVMKVLKTINKPCGLSTILSRGQGFFDSKHQLRTVLRHLVDIGEVKLQSNSQYKISNKSSFGHLAKATSKVKRTVQVSDPIVVSKPSIVPILVSEKKAKACPVKQQAKPAANDEVENEPFTLPEHLAKSLCKLEKQLSSSELSVNDVALKVEVLQRLSLLLSDDIAKVLSDVAKDLIIMNSDLSMGHMAS